MLFIDNIFSFTQAGSEVSTLLSRFRRPGSALADEMGELQERITSTRGRSITSCKPSTCPADDYHCAGDHVRPPGRHDRAIPVRCSKGIFRRGPAGVNSTSWTSCRMSTTAWPRKSSDPAAQGPSRTLSRSSVSTSWREDKQLLNHARRIEWFLSQNIVGSRTVHRPRPGSTVR